MTNNLQTHLQHSGNHLFSILFNSFFWTSNTFRRRNGTEPRAFSGAEWSGAGEKCLRLKKAVKNYRKKVVSWMLKMGLQIICQLRIWFQINKCNDRCKPKKAWISTIIYQIDGTTFICHRSAALCNGQFFKKQVCGKSLAFALSNLWQIICH